MIFRIGSSRRCERAYCTCDLRALHHTSIPVRMRFIVSKVVRRRRLMTITGWSFSFLTRKSVVACNVSSICMSWGGGADIVIIYDSKPPFI